MSLRQHRELGHRELSTSQESGKGQKRPRKTRNAHSRKQTLLRQEQWEPPSAIQVHVSEEELLEIYKGIRMQPKHEKLRGKEADVSEETFPRNRMASLIEVNAPCKCFNAFEKKL